MNQELLLRNASLVDIQLPKSNKNDSEVIKQHGKLIKEEDLTKNKVKLNILDAMLSHSRKMINSQNNNEIQNKMKLIEERELLRATSDPNTYFKGLFKQLKENHPNMPEAVNKVEAMNGKIAEKIKEGYVHLGKRVVYAKMLYQLIFDIFIKLVQPRKEDLNRISKSSYLNGSTPDLHNTNNRSLRSHHKSVQDISADKSEMKSERALDPKVILKKIKMETEQVKQLIEERKKKEEERLKQVELQEKEKKEEEKKQKHESILKALEEQKELQRQRAEEMKKNQLEFIQFQKQYKEKKPLFLIKEEEFKQKQDIGVQQDKLQKLRELYKPHKIEDFVEHYKKYEQSLLRANESERLSQKKTTFEAQLIQQASPQLWRGRVHEYVDEEIKNNRLLSASEDRKSRKLRQKSYADMIKANYIPKIDEEKKNEVSTRTNELVMPKSMVQKLILKQELTEEPSSYKIVTLPFDIFQSLLHS